MASELSADALKVLLYPERWRLVSTLLRPEARPVKRSEQQAVHSHPHQEFLFPLSGRGTYALGTRAYPTAPGMVFFFDRDEPHDNGYAPDTRDALHLWIMIVEDRAFARTLVVKDGRFTSGGFECALHAADIGIDLQRAIQDARRLSATSKGLARLRLLGLAAALAARVVDAASSTPAPGPSVQEQAIDAIKEHIARTAGAGVSLTQLARIAGFSKFHFLRLFRRHTGLTVLQYINARRRERVLELRREGISHKDIAVRLGFSCPAAFSRWWSKEKQRIV